MVDRDKKGRFVKGSIPWIKGKKGVMPEPWNKGLTKETDESMRRISDKMKGKNISPETQFRKGHKINVGRKYSQSRNKKISESFKARELTREQMVRITNLNKGKIYSIERRIKMSLGRTGEKEFTGFRSTLVKRIRVMKKYLKWRSDVFKRDNYHCQNCGEKGYLEAHHIIPFHKIIERFNIKTIGDVTKCNLLWDVGNGISYCRECHIKLDENIGKRNKIQLNKIRSNKWQ